MAMNRRRREKLSEGLGDEIEHDRVKHQQGKRISLVPGDAANLWECKNGEHFIDILPYFAGKNHPEKAEGEPTYKYRYYYHRDVGTNNDKVLCLQMMGFGDCPICDHQAELIADDADESKWEALTPKPRMLYNIICYDKGEEKKGVQVWDEAEFYSQENIMDIAKKRARSGKPSKTIEFAHPDKGKSISFERVGAKGPGSYPKYKGFTFEDRDYRIKDKLLDQCYTLDELIPIPDEDEVRSLHYGPSRERGTRPAKESRGRPIREEEPKDPMELLEDADDIDDLESIIEDYNLDVTVKPSDKFGKVRRKIKRALEEMMRDPDNDRDELTIFDLKDMTWKQLRKLMREKDIDLDLDEYDDEDELSDAIAKELDIE